MNARVKSTTLNFRRSLEDLERDLFIARAAVIGARREDILRGREALAGLWESQRRRVRGASYAEGRANGRRAGCAISFAAIGSARAI